MDITEHLIWGIIDANERIFRLQGAKKTYSQEDYADEMQKIVAPIYHQYKKIIQTGEFLYNLSRDAARGVEYSSKGRYYDPKMILNIFDDIEEAFRGGASNDDPQFRSESFVIVYDDIVDSIHGSVFVDRQIAKVQPICGDIARDAKFINSLIATYAHFDEPGDMKRAMIDYLQGVDPFKSEKININSEYGRNLEGWIIEPDESFKPVRRKGPV